MFIIDADSNAIKLTRGDTAKITVSFTDEQGDPYDMSEDVVKFGVKRSPYDTECVLEKEIDSETGKFELTPADTESMEYGDYLYDIEIRHTVEGETEEDDDTVEVYTPIAAAKFSLTYNIL